VWVETDGYDFSLMPSERMNTLSRVGFPDLSGLVERTSGNSISALACDLTRRVR